MLAFFQRKLEIAGATGPIAWHKRMFVQLDGLILIDLPPYILPFASRTVSGLGSGSFVFDYVILILHEMILWFAFLKESVSIFTKYNLTYFVSICILAIYSIIE